MTTTTANTIEHTPGLAPEFVEALAEHAAQALIDWVDSTGNKDALTALHGLLNLHYYVDAYKAGTLNQWDEESAASAIPELTKALTAMGMDWHTPNGTVEAGSIKHYPRARRAKANAATLAPLCA